MNEQPADNPATGPDGASDETTADTGAASTQTVDPYEARFAALEARNERALKAAEGAARLVHQRDQEIARYRQQESARRQNSSQGYGDEEQATEPQRQQAYDPRVSMIEFKLAHPDWQERLKDMQEVTQDSMFADRFGVDLNSRATFEAAYEVAENRKLRAELETHRAAQQKINQAKEARKNQAFVSGNGASQPQESIDRAALEKMTPEEMEKKFGKAVLSSGYFKNWS